MPVEKHNPVGRPRVLDDKKKALILEKLRTGLSRTDCADLLGINITTIQHEGERDPIFFEGLKAAETECKEFHIARIKEGAKNWQSSAWMLERKWWREFSQHAAHEFSGPNGKPIQTEVQVNLAHLTMEQVQAILDRNESDEASNLLGSEPPSAAS